MAFAPDVHVFPGGRVDPADADPRWAGRSAVTPDAAAAALGGDLDPAAALAAFVAAVREAFEEVGILLADHRPGADLAAARQTLLGDATAFPAIAEALDLRLWTDRLVPLSRWVTPPTLARRFDARFFAAAVAPDAEATLVGDEVQAHAWHRPADALESMARGETAMWLPTSTTLEQLEHATSFEEVRERSAPGRLGAVVVEEIDRDVVRIEMPAAGGVAGQPVNSYLLGRSSFVLVDPGDPTGPGLERAIEEAERRGGRIVGIALTHADPDHAAGAEALREQLGVEVYGGPGGGRHLPYPLIEIADREPLDVGDVPLVAVATPGPRADHLAFVVGAGEHVVAGDLDGRRGRRSIHGPADEEAWARSVATLRSVAPAARWLAGHPPID
jgi:glyoxylase-like metal-dependent hydrolase (beta-lactamase superfamily II)/8-oxo-dGTP pyrophosphatase MutT (NUDIX family)